MINILKTNNRGGALILYSLLAVAAVAGSALLGVRLVSQSKDISNKSLIDFQMKVVARNLKEVGKFLILYGRVFPINDALRPTNSMISLNPSSENNGWKNACGGLDAKEPNYKVDDRIVFCPFLIRDALLTGPAMEQGYFNIMYNADNSPLDKSEGGYGMYKLKQITFRIDDDDGPIIPLGIDQKIRDKISNLTVDVYFYTEGQGFKSTGAERYVRLVSTVTYSYGTGLTKYAIQKSVSKEESLMFVTTTMKEFALFMPYPLAHIIDSDSLDSLPEVDQNASFSDSVRLDRGSVINGKVYFRGGIGKTADEINDLPTFEESVILSKNFTQKIPPSDENIELIKSKFKKGFLLNFGEQLLFDQNSDEVRPGGGNQTGGLSDIINIRSYAKKFKLNCRQLEGGTVTGLIGEPVSINVPPEESDGCGTMGGWGERPVNGGCFKKLTVSDNKAFVMAPAEKLAFSGSESNFYGVYVGGSVVGEKVNFYSLSMMRPGLLGIDDKEMLRKMNSQANRISAGVSAPLRNLVLILGDI